MYLVVAYVCTPQLHPLLVDIRAPTVSGGNLDLALEVVGDTNLVETSSEVCVNGRGWVIERGC